MIYKEDTYMKKTIKETTSDIQSRIARLQRELDSEEDSLEYADGGAYSQSRDRIADLKSQIAKLKKELGGGTAPANEMTDHEYFWHRLKHMPKKPKGQDAFDSFKGRKPSEEDLSGAKFGKGDEVTFDGRFATVRFVKKTPDGFKYHIGIKGSGDEATSWAWVDEDEISPTRSVKEGSQEDALAMPSRIQEIEAQLQNNTQRLYNMLADEYLDNDKQFDELLEERDALVEELCGCRGLVEEETYEDKVHRDWLDVVQKHKSERQAIKDRIRDIVGDDKADDVFRYWDRIQSSFNMSFEHNGFRGSVEKHLRRLAKILGPEGRDIIDDINAKFAGQAKELSDYYATHDYTGD